MPVQDHKLSCDILVAGGGAAGLPCALAAARSGSRVILCQDRPVLGGNASSEVRMHVVGANGTGSFDRGAAFETEAREGGIIEEIRLENCVRNPQRSASIFDLILYEKCRAEPNLTLKLNTTVIAAEMSGQRIELVIAERQSTEDRFCIRAEIFVDCTGDGRLGLEAGAAFMEGRESRAQFGESLAGVEADQHRLGSTILLQARKHGRPMPFAAPSWARRFSKHDLRLRLYQTPGEEEPTHEYGYWWAEWGGTLDTIKDNEQIRDELLSVAMGIWDHIKNGPPEGGDVADPFDASHWAIDWIGFLPGKRESRRFFGQHVLTEHDLLSSRPFPDAIAFGGWAIDLHPPEGVDACDLPPCNQTLVPYLYDIPLGSCVSRDISNLMFAGRNISATHVAFSSTRVMATCAVVGQGVGTAAAHAIQSNETVQSLVSNQSAMNAIQQRLVRDDAFLIGCPNRDPIDVAKQASISASGEQPDGAAGNVVSGFTRSVHGPRGAPRERTATGLHRWVSKPLTEGPAWLKLEWRSAVVVSAVQLVFDTGLHRHLTLSHHDGYTSRMLWGQPQPETVRDYVIESFDGTQWEERVVVRDNYQRCRRHTFDTPVRVGAIRIEVTQTNGSEYAHVMEVRVEVARSSE